MYESKVRSLTLFSQVSKIMIVQEDLSWTNTLAYLQPPSVTNKKVL
jgi:hypothetical protein